MRGKPKRLTTEDTEDTESLTSKNPTLSPTKGDTGGVHVENNYYLRCTEVEKIHQIAESWAVQRYVGIG
jgi:hypothetical protein